MTFTAGVFTERACEEGSRGILMNVLSPLSTLKICVYSRPVDACDNIKKEVKKNPTNLRGGGH